MESSRESKVSKFFRVLLSFVLFASIALMSISVCTKVFVVDKGAIEKNFVSFEYVNGTRQNIVDAATDIYLKNGLDYSDLDNKISYELIENAVREYTARMVESNNGYSDETCEQAFNDIYDVFRADINEKAKQAGYDNKDAVEKIGTSFKNYLEGCLNIDLPEKAGSYLNMANIAFFILIGVFAFIAAASGLILFFIGKKRYRCVRKMGISIASAGIYDLAVALIFYIIFSVKNINIYPIYLHDALIQFLYNYIGSLAVMGCSLMVLSIVIFAIVWKMKRAK